MDDEAITHGTTASAIHNDEERLRLIAETIERLRHTLQADGGDIELMGVDGHRVKVWLKGACAGCSLANETLGWIRRTLAQALGGGPVLVVPTAKTCDDHG